MIKIKKLIIGGIAASLIFVAIIGLAASKSAWSPWDYDKNNDDVISLDEMIKAKNHYRFGEITKEQVVDVLKIYFETAPTVGHI